MSSNRRQSRTPTRSRPAARIAADRARRGTTSRKRTGQSRTRASEGRQGKSASSARSPRRGKSANESGGKSRVWLWLVGMGLVGFLTVYTGTSLQRVFNEGKLKAYDAATLLDKLVDRMLDRDVPRRNAKAAPAKAATANPQKEAAKKTQSARVDEPAAKVPETPRAEIKAEAPERYAQQSRSLHEVRQRNAARDNSRARIDAILQKVGLDPDVQ